jgi:hypothetical protein
MPDPREWSQYPRAPHIPRLSPTGFADRLGDVVAPVANAGMLGHPLLVALASGVAFEGARYVFDRIRRR